MPDQPPLRTLRLSDGARLAYREAGRGRPLLLAHGWAMSGAAFAPQWALADRFRVVAPDLRGFGASDVAGPLTIARLGEDLDELARALGLSGAVVVGWSLGAMVAWSLIDRRAPGWIAGLIVEDMSPRIVNDDGWALGLANGHDAAAAARAERAMLADWPATVAAMLGRLLAEGREGREAALLDDLAVIAGATDPRAAAAVWRALAAHDARPALPRVRVPALVANGELSRLYRPAVAEAVAAAMPAARRVRFAASGHAPHLEEPAAFNRMIESFAAGLPAAHAAHAAAGPP